MICSRSRVKTLCSAVNQHFRQVTHTNPPHPHTRPGIRPLVVVKALAGLLEVSIAFLGGGEACLGQVLPVEGPTAQLAMLPLAPGPLDGQQLDVACEGDAPSCQTP